MALSDSLRSYWEMEESSGDALDSHSTYDLTDTNTVTSATGIVGNARSFASASFEYFNHADNTHFSSITDFSWSLWVKTSTGTGFPVAFTKRADTNSKNGYVVFLRSGKPEFSMWTGSGTTSTSVASGSSIADGNWHHIVATHDDTANEIALIVDDGTPVTNAHTAGVNATGGPFHIGASVAQSLWWNGQIDEVGFWGKVLSASEITDLYNSGSGISYASITGGGSVVPIIHQQLAS